MSGEQGVDLAAQPRIEMREYIYDMPRGAGSGGSHHLPRRRGDHRRGLRQWNTLHHGTEPKRDRQPSGKKTPGCSNAPARPQSSARQTATEKSLYETAKSILSDAGRMRAMRASARDMAVVDAAERIYQTALDLAKH